MKWDERLRKKSVLTVLVCLLAAVGMFYVVNYPPVVGASSTERQLPIYCVQRDQKLVSISIASARGDGIVR